MKKLMIGAAVAAITVGAFADLCNEAQDGCIAWDVKMNLKSITPKKLACLAGDPCDESRDRVYYMDNITRKIKGYLWICEYVCGEDMNLVLWDNKKIPLVIWRGGEDTQKVNFDQVYVYGKKANKVAGTINFAGEMDNEGKEGINVLASGVNGKFVRGKAEDDCYVKSLSGYAAGTINCAVVERTIKTEKKKGSLCEDPVDADEVVCDEYLGSVFSWCDACCFDTYCDEDASLQQIDQAPAVGTWSMKYNKKLSKGHTPITSVIPAYAL